MKSTTQKKDGKIRNTHHLNKIKKADYYFYGILTKFKLKHGFSKVCII